MRHPTDAFGMDPYSPAVSAILRVLEGFDPGEERSLGDLAVDIDAAARPIIAAEVAATLRNEQADRQRARAAIDEAEADAANYMRILRARRGRAAVRTEPEQ